MIVRDGARHLQLTPPVPVTSVDLDVTRLASSEFLLRVAAFFGANLGLVEFVDFPHAP